MKARTLRLMTLTLLLAAMGRPWAAQAQAPVVSNNSLATVAGVAQSIYLNNYTTWSGGQTYSLTYTNLTQPQHGFINYPNSFYSYYCTYTCTNQNYVGPDSFVWRAANGSQTSGLATLSISVVTNTPPVVLPCTIALPIGVTNLSYMYLGGSVVHPDADSGQTMTYFIRSQPVSGGSLSLSYGSGYPYFNYSAPPGFVNGTESFTWSASDGIATSAPAVCTITLSTNNTVPTATACTNTAPSGAIVTNAMPYTDPDSGQTWTAIVKSQPAHGTAWLDASGGVSLDYCSAPGFAGTDTFTFAISDGVSVSAPAVCTMIVAPSLPVALVQTVVAMTNTPITIPLSYRGGGGYTNWPVAQKPANGSITATNGTKISYTPKNNWKGNDTFKWVMAYSNATTPTTLSSVTAICTVVVKDLGSNTNCDWTQWRFDECRTAQSPALLPNQLFLQWQRTLPTCANAFDGGYYSIGGYQCDLDRCRPVQLGKHLFVPCLANDSMSAFNTDTGAQQWRYYTSGALRRPPLALALTNGTNVVIFGCDDGYLYCLNALDGSEVWKFRAAPLSKKAMGYGRLSSVWPIWSSPVAYNNRIYVVAGYLQTWNLFGYCLDAASGAVIWKNDGAMHGKNDNNNSALAPLSFSTDHTTLIGTMDRGSHFGTAGWLLNPATGQCSTPRTGLYALNSGGGSGKGYYPPYWYVDGSGASAQNEPISVTAGGQTFTPTTVAGLGVPGTVGSMLVGDSKLFVSTTDGNLYSFGTNVVQTNYYAYTVTPLPKTNDVWTTVVQTILTNRPDLGQGLALVWGIGSGRLVTELAQQAPGLMIVAADPDFNKLQTLRAKMDAAGWSGARVSTVQGNPMDCGFAPYQAALIVSEDVNVAGFSSNGMTMAKILYTCTRPFGGQVWLPTNDVADMTAWLSAAHLPTCSNGPSYQVTSKTISGLGFICLQRLGMPDASLALKPPFRLIAFDLWQSDHTPRPGIPSKGVNAGYDIYSWRPVTASEPGYEPVVVNAQTGQWGGGPNNSFPYYYSITNSLFSCLETRPEMWCYNGWTTIPGSWGPCSGWTVYNNTTICAGKTAWLATFDASYWGLFMMPEMGGVCSSENAAGNGVVGFIPTADCGCENGMNLPQIALVSTDEANEEQWVQYRMERSMRAIQEMPIRTIGVNFGAPGDRWDAADQLVWTHHPWQWNGSLCRWIPESQPLLPVSYRGSVSNQYHWSGAMATTSTNYHGWVSASYVSGMSGLTIPLAQPLVAVRGAPALPLNGTINDVCWSNCAPINLFTSCGSASNCTNSYVKLCYDTTNLYVAGVLQRPGPRPLSSAGVYPAYMKVALKGRDQNITPIQVPQFYIGDGGPKSSGLLTNAWTGAYTTNMQMFAGEICIPWTNLLAAGIWTSQLVMNVEVCGDLLNGNNNWQIAGSNLLMNGTGPNPQSEVTTYLSPVYFDAARGPMAEVIPHTMRLYFAEMEGLTNGQRVFDVKLQGQTVLTNFDVFAAAGGRGCCEVIKEFGNVGIASALNIDFVAHTGQPILGGVEIVATGTNAPNQPPVAVLDASTLSGPAPLSVLFSAQRSYDPDGQIVECAWDAGDGRVTRGSTLQHIFTEPGTYTVSLLVLDNGGATAATNLTVTVTPGVPAAFVCNIRSNLSTSVTGGDYTNLSAWATAMGGDNGTSYGGDVASVTTVYRVSSWAGTMGGNAVTFPGGMTGVIRYVTTWVTNGVTTTNAEVAWVGGTGTVTTGKVTYNGINTNNFYFVITDTGVATTSLLFTVSATNSYRASSDDNQIVIFPGGGVGRLKHINQASPNLAYITECRGNIQTGIVTCAATGHNFAINDTGHPVVALVADCYNDWPNGLTNAVTLQPVWITDPAHCVVIRAAAGQGHLGKLKGVNGAYSGFALASALNAAAAPFTRVKQVINNSTNGIIVGACGSVTRVLGSVTVSDNGATVANSIGAMFSTKNSQDISLHNCTAGSFVLSNAVVQNAGMTLIYATANRVRTVNCLAYTNGGTGFPVDPTSEIWLNHCVSLDGTANLADAWQDGNIGNLANQAVSFANAANGDYHLAAGDTGARGQGQPGLGADIDGNLRTGPTYDVGAHQTTNALSAFQQWQMQYFGSLTALNAASNALNSAGISNYQMFLAGSNPNDSNTWFRFTAIKPTAGNKLGATFNTVSGKTYTVNWKTNLLDGLGWQFYTNLSGLGGAAQVIFTNSLPQAFFQIQTQ